jgi:hypothetical protein
MYNTATLLLVSGFTAVALTSGLLARELVSIYKIPSRSMDPTILSGHRVGQLKHAVALSGRVHGAPYQPLCSQVIHSFGRAQMK